MGWCRNPKRDGERMSFLSFRHSFFRLENLSLRFLIPVKDLARHTSDCWTLRRVLQLASGNISFFGLAAVQRRPASRHQK